MLPTGIRPAKTGLAGLQAGRWRNRWCLLSAGDQPPMFLCPCHGASFDLDGKRLQEDSPSARDLDELDVDIRNGDEVFVKLENFHTGIPEKIVKS